MASRKRNTRGGPFWIYLLICFLIVVLVGAIAEWLHISFLSAVLVIITVPVILFVSINLALFSAKPLITKLREKWFCNMPSHEPPSFGKDHIQTVPDDISDNKRYAKMTDAAELNILRPRVTAYCNKPKERGGLGHMLNQPVQDCTIVVIAATGYGADTGEIIELTAIKLRGLEPVEVFQSLIRPTSKLTNELISETGITNLMLSKAPCAHNVFPAFVDFLGDDVVVGFNAKSTMSFLYDVLLNHTDHVLSNNYLDMQRLAWEMWPGIEAQSISDISNHLGASEGHSGRTMGKCETLASCYQLMAKMSFEIPADEVPAENGNGVTLDELLIPAIDWIIDNNTASTSALRREFRIGYTRAQSLMQQIELLGVVGPSQGSKSREVLMGVNPLKD